MKTIVLTIQKDLKSASELGFETTTRLDGHTEDYDDCVVIRYGNSYFLRSVNGYISDYKNVINSARSVRDNCRHKDFTLKKISKVVKTPQIWVCGDKTPEGKMVVYRPTKHTQGSSFKVVPGGFTVDPDFYATEWIDTDKEFRVWFVNNGNECQYVIARRFSQIPEENNKQFKCRSMWSYNFIKKDKFEILKSKVKLISDALKIEFGAVDVLSKDGVYYFLECNTAPSIDYPILKEFFTNGINGIIQTKFKDLLNPPPVAVKPAGFNYRNLF